MSYEECEELAVKLETFLALWDDRVISIGLDTVRTDNQGNHVFSDVPEFSKYGIVSRRYLQECIKFLRNSGGRFRIDQTV